MISRVREMCVLLTLYNFIMHIFILLEYQYI